MFRTGRCSLWLWLSFPWEGYDQFMCGLDRMLDEGQHAMVFTSSGDV